MHESRCSISIRLMSFLLAWRMYLGHQSYRTQIKLLRNEQEVLTNELSEKCLMNIMKLKLILSGHTVIIVRYVRDHFHLLLLHMSHWADAPTQPLSSAQLRKCFFPVLHSNPPGINPDPTTYHLLCLCFLHKGIFPMQMQNGDCAARDAD
jgi:hypothetical protein